MASCASAADTLTLHDRKDMLYFEAAQLSAGKAIKQAGITLDQINFFEYHDAFSIYAALQLESVGFAIRGQGWKLAADSSIGLKGRIPSATFGGLKAAAFPAVRPVCIKRLKQRPSCEVRPKRTRPRAPNMD